MNKGEMPRAYLRMDPNIDQVFPVLRNTFIGLMCSAGRQPERGRYRDRRTAELLHSKPFIRQAFERGDLVELPDKRVYLVGWDEWQEGDFTVAERMRRMRKRRAEKKRHPVTVEASPDRSDVTTDAVSTVNTLVVGVGGGEAPQPPTRGGRRSDATNARAIAADMTRRAELEERERKARRNARYIAQQAGRITPEQRAEMDEADTPLSEIPPTRGAAYGVPA